MTNTSTAGNLNASHERPASTFNGYLALALSLALLGLGVRIIILLANDDVGLGQVPVAILAMLGAAIGFGGFYMLQPNQAAVITLFGSYRGTDRAEGLRWVWPWMIRAKISARANNVISDKIKVNDLRGNPIEIAAQVVELDDERRAAMVSNLMVVLCGERDTQPVLNTGSLY